MAEKLLQIMNKKNSLNSCANLDLSSHAKCREREELILFFSHKLRQHLMRKTV